jgi:hypothetical protein
MVSNTKFIENNKIQAQAAMILICSIPAARRAQALRC